MMTSLAVFPNNCRENLKSALGIFAIAWTKNLVTCSSLFKTTPTSSWVLPDNNEGCKALRADFCKAKCEQTSFRQLLFSLQHWLYFTTKLCPPTKAALSSHLPSQHNSHICGWSQSVENVLPSGLKVLPWPGFPSLRQTRRSSGRSPGTETGASSPAASAAPTRPSPASWVWFQPDAGWSYVPPENRVMKWWQQWASGQNYCQILRISVSLF